MKTSTRYALLLEQGMGGHGGEARHHHPPTVMLNLFQHPTIGNHRLMPIERNPCVYILTSQPRETVYTDVTSDLMQRLRQHREGTIDGFTKRYDVHRLVRFELFGDMGRAITREKQPKRWHRQWKINLIEQDNPHWVDLAVRLGFEPMGRRAPQDGS